MRYDEYLRRLNYQAITVFVLASVLSAYVIMRQFNAAMILVAAAIFLVLVGAWLSIKHFIESRNKALLERFIRDQELEDRVLGTMSLDDAKRRTTELLNDPQWFSVEKEHADNFNYKSELSAEIAAFFSEYKLISAVHTKTIIDRDQIGPAEITGAIKIAEETGFFDILAAPGQDRVYEDFGDKESLSEMHSYASIYHWLIAVANAGGSKEFVESQPKL
jgi:hypothetical protein